MKNIKSLCKAVVLGLLATGCATTQARLMPSETTVTISPWKSYKEAEHAYGLIKPYQTTLTELRKIVDPENTVLKIEHLPNVKYMDAVAIQNVFMKPGTSGNQKIPKEVERCLAETFEQCYSYEISHKYIIDKGVGNLYKRWLNFRKENVARGPDVVFQIFLRGELVIHKRWEGTSDVKQVKLKINPLGPLQEPFELILKYTPSP